jgi:Protein of unknown function (DUF2911)
MKSTFLYSALFFIYCGGISTAQNLPQTQASPHAKVSQEIGLSEITIDYHRPAVKGREIWGKLVPYGMTNLGFGTAKESPWRAGANENTTITFSDEVKIDGESLPAGTYGLHMIVTEKEWTIIFNKVSTAWGSFFYDPAYDQLRVTATPSKSDFTEWLQYGFENLTPASADVYLKWENMKIKFTALFDVERVVLDRYEKLLVGAQGFNQANFQQAALYFITKNIYLDEAGKWLEHSIALQPTGSNLITKSILLEKTGRKDEPAQFLKKGIDFASEAELNNFGYFFLLQQKEIDKAIEIFKINIDKHPDSWNVYDSLAEAYGNKGDKENAVKNYKLASAKAPANQKQRIEKAIENLK